MKLIRSSKQCNMKGFLNNISIKWLAGLNVFNLWERLRRTPLMRLRKILAIFWM